MCSWHEQFLSEYKELRARGVSSKDAMGAALEGADVRIPTKADGRMLLHFVLGEDKFVILPPRAEGLTPIAPDLRKSPRRGRRRRRPVRR
jgi:hypothetical protein